VTETPPEEVDFEITNWQVTALEQLIDEVKSSDLSEDVSGALVTILNSLLDGLQEKQQESVMVAAVKSAMTLVDGVIDGVNSYTTLVTMINSEENIADLGAAIADAADSYHMDGKSVTEYAQAQQKASELDENITTILTTGSQFFTEGTSGLRGNALTAKLKTYSDEINAALAASGLDSQDGLVAAVYGLYQSFNSVIASVNFGGSSASGLQFQIAAACQDFVTDATVALSVQTYNCIMGEYINNRLKSIFSIASDVVDSSTDDSEAGSEEDKDTSGGYGDRDVNYGSDDLIFYPDDETYVEYGTVLDSYFAKMQEIIGNGDLSEELKKYISNYFDILYGGLNTDDEQTTQENQDNLTGEQNG
jgi:hypothetical protein